MKTKTLAVLLAVAASVAGCRRTDIREYVIEIPGVAQKDVAAIRDAISVYEGVKLESLSWDFDKGRLTLKLDTMKVAATNIRHAIAEKTGLAVKYPEPSGPAGYINKRPNE